MSTRTSTRLLTAAAERAAAEGNALASAEGAPELTIIVDTREQAPWTFEGELVTQFRIRLATVRGTLDTGDYAIAGHEDLARIERKSLADFVACCTRERARFWRELERLRLFPFRAVIVECSFADMWRAAFRSQVAPLAVIATALAIMVDFGIPVIPAGGRGTAEGLCAWMLRRVLRRALQAVEEKPVLLAEIDTLRAERGQLERELAELEQRVSNKKLTRSARGSRLLPCGHRIGELDGGDGGVPSVCRGCAAAPAPGASS